MNSDLQYPDTLMTRHAVQNLLHHAIHFNDDFCDGVLIGEQGCIYHHQTSQSFDSSLGSSKKNGQVLGLYRAYTDPQAVFCMQDVLEIIARVGLDQAPMIFMAIILSTKGRVENIAFHVSGHQLLPLKLTMKEDGQMKMQKMA